MDPQSNHNQKGIAYLNSKAWYRFLKVLYVLIVGTVIGLFIYELVFFDWHHPLFWIASIVVFFFLEIPKRSLYYVVAGRVFPNR